MVNEILPTGQVVHLDNLKVPRVKPRECDNLTASSNAVPTENLPPPTSAQPGLSVGSAENVPSANLEQNETSGQPTSVHSLKPANHASIERPSVKAPQENEKEAGKVPIKRESRTEKDISVTRTEDGKANAPTTGEGLLADKTTNGEPPSVTPETPGSVQAWQNYASEPSAFQVHQCIASSEHSCTDLELSLWLKIEHF